MSHAAAHLDKQGGNAWRPGVNGTPQDKGAGDCQMPLILERALMLQIVSAVSSPIPALKQLAAAVPVPAHCLRQQIRCKWRRTCLARSST